MSVNPIEGTGIDAVAERLAAKRVPEQTKPETNEEPIVEYEANFESEEEVVEEYAAEDEIEVESEVEEPEEEFEEEPELYTVKIDGEEKEVTLDELRNGYQMEADYRKKTADLADQRKDVETAKEKLEEERTSYATVLEKQQQIVEELDILQQAISQPLYTDAQLSHILENQGEKAFLKAQQQEQKRQKDFETIKSRKEEQQQQVQKEQQASLERLAVKEQALLKKTMPEIMSGEGNEKFVNYVVSLGYTEEDLNNTIDHRLYVAMEKARRYDEIKAKRVEKEKKKAPKVTRRTARKDKSTLQQKKLQDLKNKARKSGKPEDLAVYMQAKKRNS